MDPIITGAMTHSRARTASAIEINRINTYNAKLHMFKMRVSKNPAIMDLEDILDKKIRWKQEHDANKLPAAGATVS